MANGQNQSKEESLLIQLMDDIEPYREQLLRYGKILTTSSETIKATLKELFPQWDCISVEINNNTDKMPFGVYVLPMMSDWDVKRIIMDSGENSDSQVQVKEYKMELDSRLFDQYYGGEIVAMIITAVYSMMNPDNIDKIRFAVNAALCNSGKYAAGYVLTNENMKPASMAIFRYVIVSFLRNFNYETNELKAMPYMDMMDLDKVIDGLKNNSNPIAGVEYGNSIVSGFKWASDITDELENHAVDAIDTMDNVLRLTGSRLEREMVLHIIEMLKGATNTDLVEKSLKEEATLNEGFSLFKNIKTNGLRAIEDDLFEYKIRIKNCEDQEDAMYILRQINTRLTILDDYLRNTDNISDSERKRWMSCMDSYRALRAEIGHKKLGDKKQYGIFIDYDKLDTL